MMNVAQPTVLSSNNAHNDCAPPPPPQQQQQQHDEGSGSTELGSTKRTTTSTTSTLATTTETPGDKPELQFGSNNSQNAHQAAAANRPLVIKARLQHAFVSCLPDYQHYSNTLWNLLLKRNQQTQQHSEEEEEATLKNASDVCSTVTGRQNFCLISGCAGTGKNVLAQETFSKQGDRPTTEARGKFHDAETEAGASSSASSSSFYCVQARFDASSSTRPLPYSAVVSAVSSFAAQVKQRGKVAVVRQAILAQLNDDGASCVADNVSVLTDMIPALHDLLVVGSTSIGSTTGGTGQTVSHIMEEETVDSEGTDISQQHAQHHDKKKHHSALNQRFIFAFRMFFRAIVNMPLSSSLMKEDHVRLVVVLQDLHHADPCSLEMLLGMATDPIIADSGGLLLIGTINEEALQNSNCPWVKALQDLHRISLGTMPPLESIHSMEAVLRQALNVKSVCSSEEDVIKRLAQLALTHTGGDMFRLVHFVHWLQEQGLLCFHKGGDGDGTEYWELRSPEEIQMVFSLENVGDFLMDKLKQLPDLSQQVLKVACCLGPTFEARLLEYILDQPVDCSVQDLCQRGLFVVERRDSCSGNGAVVVIEHDEVQQATCRLIPEAERELFHLEIGRRLWRKLSSRSRQDLEKNLFAVLSQMRAGRRLITREKERIAIASLCLYAGRLAAGASTFPVAFVYLQMGLELLVGQGEDEEQCWRDHYGLALDLYCAAAEMAMCCARFEESNQLLEPVFRHARSFQDKIQAYTTKMCSLSQQNLSQECVDLGIRVLETELGETFPQRLCLARMAHELRTCERLVKGKSNEQLLRMPNMTNTTKLCALQILAFMYLPALTHRPKFAPFVALKCVKITLQHGMSVFASGSFGIFGMLYISAGRDPCDAVQKASRWASLALSLWERNGGEFLPRVYAGVYGCILPWTRPVSSMLEPLRHGYDVGMLTGDAEFGGLCASLYCFSAMQSGTPLPVIFREWKVFEQSLVSARQAYILNMFLPTLQCIHHFMGLTEDPLSPRGDLIDFDEIVRRSTSSLGQQAIDSDVISMRYCKMMLGYYFGDIEMAHANGLTMQDIRLMPPSFERVFGTFYLGLVAIEAARQGYEYRKNVRTAKSAEKWLKGIAELAPHNGLDKLCLLQAEMASLLMGRQKKKGSKAFAKFLMAIALTNTSGHAELHGLCNERMARHLLRVSNNSSSNKEKQKREQRTEVEDPMWYFEQACKSYQRWGATAKVTRLQEEMQLLKDGNGVSVAGKHGSQSH